MASPDHSGIGLHVPTTMGHAGNLHNIDPDWLQEIVDWLIFSRSSLSVVTAVSIKSTTSLILKALNLVLSRQMQEVLHHCLAPGLVLEMSFPLRMVFPLPLRLVGIVLPIF